MRRVLFCILLLFLAVAPYSIVNAHSLGYSLEATSSPFFIDIGYDEPTFEAGRASRFEFELRAEEDLAFEHFDHVWVRVMRERKTLLATGVRFQTFGPTTLLYTFPEQGTFALSVSYRTADGEELAANEFSITVVEGERVFPAPYLVGGVILTPLLLFGAYVLFRRSRNVLS